jgi:hypothetical protein
MAIVTLMLAGLAAGGCRNADTARGRAPLQQGAWIENDAVARGHIEPGDFAQFGCPAGWKAAGDTAASLRGRGASTTYRGIEAPPRGDAVTCVAQREFSLPPPYATSDPAGAPVERPLAPVWVSMDADATTIGFRREVPPDAALHIGQDTPCGPHLIGVRLGDLLKWLSDPPSAVTRDFLGLISAGCPERGPS